MSPEEEARLRSLEIIAAERGAVIASIREDLGEIKDDQKASRTMVKSVLLTAAASIIVQIVMAVIIFVFAKGGTP